MTTLLLSILLLSSSTSEALVAPTRLCATPLDAQDPSHSFFDEPPRNGFTVTNHPDEWIAQELSKEVLDLSEQLRNEKGSESSFDLTGTKENTVRDWKTTAVPTDDDNDSSSVAKVESTAIDKAPARSIDNRLQALNAQLEATRLDMDEITKENHSLKQLQEQHHRDMDDITKRLEQQIQQRVQERARATKELEAIRRESRQALKKVHRDADARIHEERSQFRDRLEKAEALLQQLKESLEESERRLAQKNEELVGLEAKQTNVKEFSKTAQNKLQRLKKLVQKPFAGRTNEKAVNGDATQSTALHMTTAPVVEQDS